MLRALGWFVYPTLVLVLLLAALGRRGHADSPPAPPPLPAPERGLLGDIAPIDPAALVRVRRRHGPNVGTAFSVGDGGVWLTAAAPLQRCAHPAVLVNDLEGVAARADPGPGGRIAVLVSARGAPALSLAAAAPRPGALAYAPGFPRGRPGELAVHLIGARMLRSGRRGGAPAQTMVWAEMGRTEGLEESLTGLAGAPLLDGQGRVVGLVLGAAPRRGRIYAATPAELAAALAAAKAPQPAQGAGATITSDVYGLAADALRRQLRVAPTACIAP
ncbi:MAG TPA: trypsin-like peptidase domain-containing protein [Caulobacteraceae bacterium]|nr:trypsin-like peptidase domain-containing protein [Caulobacteraceae bacterium]